MPQPRMRPMARPPRRRPCLHMPTLHHRRQARRRRRAGQPARRVRAGRRRPRGRHQQRVTPLEWRRAFYRGFADLWAWFQLFWIDRPTLDLLTDEVIQYGDGWRYQESAGALTSWMHSPPIQNCTPNHHCSHPNPDSLTFVVFCRLAFTRPMHRSWPPSNERGWPLWQWRPL